MRDFERDIIPMCHDEGMGLCPYGALNQGRFQTAQVFKEREKHNPGRNMKPTTVRDRQVSLVLEKIAGERGLDLRQVALAYVYYKAPYVTPIIGGRKLEHLKSNIAGLGVSLTDDEIAAIDAAFPFDHGFPHTFLSGSLFEENAAPRGAFGPEDVWLTKHQGEFDWVKAPKPVVPALTQD
jgi:aryl-alcohol dehydrogenase-like predicted oxidoreductase